MTRKGINFRVLKYFLNQLLYLFNPQPIGLVGRTCSRSQCPTQGHRRSVPMELRSVHVTCTKDAPCGRYSNARGRERGPNRPRDHVGIFAVIVILSNISMIGAYVAFEGQPCWWKKRWRGSYSVDRTQNGGELALMCWWAVGRRGGRVGGGW